MPQTHERPTLVGKNTSTTTEAEFAHPAYGRITLGKITAGGGVHLSGSDLKHTQLVSIKIELANEQRSLHENRTRRIRTVCEVLLSEAQFAHFISSQGMGDGNPCTFRMRPADGYQLMNVPAIQRDETPQETYAREVQEKCEKAVAEAAKALEHVRALAAAGKANKGQMVDLVAMLSTIAERLPNRMAFAQDQFAEAMAKTVNDGKIELEAHIVNVAMATGLEQLRAAAPRMLTAAPDDEAA